MLLGGDFLHEDELVGVAVAKDGLGVGGIFGFDGEVVEEVINFDVFEHKFRYIRFYVYGNLTVMLLLTKPSHHI